MFSDHTSNQAAQAEVSGDYWHQSRRPLASLAFMTPLLVLSELGVLALGSHAVRNGADVWLRQLLDLLGFSQYFLLPLLTVAIPLAWHGRRSIRDSCSTTSGASLRRGRRSSRVVTSHGRSPIP